MNATDFELLTMAAWKLSDTLEAINEGTWSCEDKDWKKDLETLLSDISKRLKK